MIFLFKIGFLSVSFWDLLDVLIVGYLFYVLYKISRGSLAFNILIGVVVLIAFYGLVSAMGMSLLSRILGSVANYGFIVLVVVFQSEIRRFLVFLGRNFIKNRGRFLERFLGISTNSIKTDTQQMDRLINKVSTAVEKLSKRHTGALIVFSKNPELEGLANTGVVLNANISSRLIESIFHKESPLHDGAMLVSNDRIYSVGGILPVSESDELPKSAGLRHRAGVGVTEQSDAFSVIVSEETGRISVAQRGKLTAGITKDELSQALRKTLKQFDALEV